MNALQIHRAIAKDALTKDSFKGVIAANELPTRVRQRPSAYVVNTDDRGQPGTHWVAFYFPKSGPSEFFDSLGRPPIYYRRQFKSALLKNGPRYLYNNIKVQAIGTKVCGQYCISYLKLRCRNWTLKRIVNYLKK